MIESPEKSGLETKKFVHASGREATGVIKSKDFIGRGGLGEVYRAEIALQGRGDEERIRDIKDSFIVKEFYGENEGRAKNALQAHSLLEKAGVETWKTYRRIDGEEAVIMSDGEKDDDSFLISTSDASRSKNAVLETKMSHIEGLGAAMENALENIMRASEHGIFLQGDAWLAEFGAASEIQPKTFLEKIRSIVVRKEIATQRILKKVFVGDYDNVFLNAEAPESEGVPPEDLTYHNILHFYLFLVTLISQTVSEKFVEKLEEFVDKKLVSLVEEKKIIDAARWESMFQRTKELRNLAKNGQEWKRVYSPKVFSPNK